jgi:hypothetical protein
LSCYSCLVVVTIYVCQSNKVFVLIFSCCSSLTPCIQMSTGSNLSLMMGIG